MVYHINTITKSKKINISGAVTVFKFVYYSKHERFIVLEYTYYMYLGKNIILKLTKLFL